MMTRSAPESVEAEAAVLGSMILDRECRVEELPQEAERRCWQGIIG